MRRLQMGWTEWVCTIGKRSLMFRLFFLSKETSADVLTLVRTPVSPSTAVQHDESPPPPRRPTLTLP